MLNLRLRKARQPIKLHKDLEANRTGSDAGPR
jgi:hypothetical protein